MVLNVTLTPKQLKDLRDDISRVARLECEVRVADDDAILIERDINNVDRCHVMIPIRDGVTLKALQKLQDHFEPTIPPSLELHAKWPMIRLYSIPQSRLGVETRFKFE